MKRILSILALMLVCIGQTFAENTDIVDEFEVDGIYYHTIEGAKRCVAVIAPFYNDPKRLSGDIIIPENVVYYGRSYKVIFIDRQAFEYFERITSITLPKSILGINDAAFIYCRGIKSINLPDSLQYIGRRAFGDCTGLTSITIPNSVKSIGEKAFEGCI